jgi:orotidine-5'-phosphate decarboxylase
VAWHAVLVDTAGSVIAHGRAVYHATSPAHSSRRIVVHLASARSDSDAWAIGRPILVQRNGRHTYRGEVAAIDDTRGGGATVIIALPPRLPAGDTRK